MDQTDGQLKEQTKNKERPAKYLNGFEGELNRISVKYSVPVKEIRYIVDDFFERLKGWIVSPKMPTVKISNFGTFKPDKSQIVRSLKRMIKTYRLGYTPPETLRRHIMKLWPIRKRLQKEERKQNTWKKWKNMLLIKDTLTAELRLPHKTDENI